jgi:hypothetical protein
VDVRLKRLSTIVGALPAKRAWQTALMMVSMAGITGPLEAQPHPTEAKTATSANAGPVPAAHHDLSRPDPEAFLDGFVPYALKSGDIAGDEIYLGNKQKFLTVVTNLETGEPLWVGRERKKETLDEFFEQQLSAFQRNALQAACVDMWEPFRQSLEQWVPQCRIVYDKFHILQHAGKAVGESFRAVFAKMPKTLASNAVASPLSVYRQALRKLENWKTEINGSIALACLLACTGILVHSFVDFNLQIPAYSAWFYVLAVLAASPYAVETP